MAGAQAVVIPYIHGTTFNFVVDNGANNIGSCDCTWFCDRHRHPEPVHRIADGSTMWDLLVIVGVFSSKNQARKNWTGPREIPMGYSEHQVGGSKRRKFLYVWNPPPFDLTMHMLAWRK